MTQRLNFFVPGCCKISAKPDPGERRNEKKLHLGEFKNPEYRYRIRHFTIFNINTNILVFNVKIK